MSWIGGIKLKEMFLDHSVSFLMKYQKYSDDELERLRYGLEGLYLTLTKLVVIVGLSFILHIFKEVIAILALFNIIRYFGFGIHAKRSIECLITSLIFFIVIPYLLLHVELPKTWILIIGIILIISYLIWAPADTVKRPLPNNKKKKFRKMMTVLIGIIYLILSLAISAYQISILFFITMVIQAIVICPITYMLLRQPYNNFKNLDV